jgi:hypothetical protein
MGIGGETEWVDEDRDGKFLGPASLNDGEGWFSTQYVVGVSYSGA